MSLPTKLCAAVVTAVSVCTASSPAHAAWVDVSYDPNPAQVDEDRAAQFDSFGILSHIVNTTNGRTKYIQNFESGFVPGQRLDDWVTLGATRVRFGFGLSLDTVQWQATIGGIDPYATQFGMNHPHGTYGNAAGILDQPRNYVADLHFLTFDSPTPPTYVVMQFERPISWLGFSTIDYAAATGGNASLSLWNGTGLGSLVELPLSHPAQGNRTFPADGLAGDIGYFVGNGAPAVALPGGFPPFNWAILRVDAADATIGFDNFTVGLAPVPEPKPHVMMAGGLLMLGALARRSRRLHGTE